MSVNGARFRQVLGQYPTGVVVVTAAGASGEPIGMTVGSFTSVSIDPPLVAFLPDQRSGSWSALRASGERFCVNILSSGQEEVCRRVATRKQDKFEGIEWERSPGGHPVIVGAVAYIDCTVEVIHDAGDHHIVVGRVEHLDTLSSHYPLLFFRGGYGSFSPLSLGAADGDLLTQMRLVDLIRPTIEKTATEIATEVSVLCLVGDEMVIAASAGQERSAEVPTRVGQRWSFVPPVGLVFAAWSDEETRTRWVERAAARLEPREHVEWLLDRVRRDGYVMSVSTTPPPDPGDATDIFRSGQMTITTAMAEHTLRSESMVHNPSGEDLPDLVSLRSVTVPVFAGSGNAVCALAIWGSHETLPYSVIEHTAARAVAAAERASAILGSA